MIWTRLALPAVLAGVVAAGPSAAQTAKGPALKAAQAELKEAEQNYATAVSEYKSAKDALKKAPTDAAKQKAVTDAAKEKKQALDDMDTALKLVERLKAVAGDATPAGKKAAAPPKVNEEAELKKLLGQKQAGTIDSLAELKLDLKGVDSGEQARLNRLIRYAVLTGMSRYQQGHYAESAMYYRAGLMVAWPFLDKIEASHKGNSGLERRVAAALRSANTDHLTGATTADWQQAVVLRTALNDILNAPHRGDPDTLIRRLGGSDAVRHIFQDAASRSAADVSRVVVDPNAWLYPVLGRGGCEPLGRAGTVIAFPFDFPSTSDAEFTRTARLHAFSRHLNTSLGRYCVPEPERDELFKRLGVELLPF